MKRTMNVLWVLPVVLALVFAGQMSGCSKASQPYQSGKLYFSQKLYEKAAEQFEIAVQEDPETGKNYRELAKAYAELDKNEEAGENFRMAVQKTPELKDEVQDAVQHYRADHYNRGVELMKEKSYGDALGEFQEAAYLNQDDPNQYINMGFCYSEIGETDLAVRYYEKALALSPEDEMARTNLIGTFANQAADFRREKDYEQAINFYRKVLELTVDEEGFAVENSSPDQILAKVEDDEKGTGYLFDLGITYLDMAEDTGDEDALNRAADIFKVLYDHNPADDDALYYYAYGNMVAEDYEEAISAFGQLLDRTPREPTYYMSMAQAYVKAGGSSDMQMKGVLYFALAKALGSDEYKLEKSKFRNESTLQKRLGDEYATWKDMKATMESLGVPENIYAYKEDSGSDVECWFYWTKGQAVVFTNGYETGRIQFAPQE